MSHYHTLLAPAYRDSRAEVTAIVSRFDSDGAPVHAGRNTIKTFTTPRGVWNVKRYHIPALPNRFVYTFLRRPKGLRAFLYAEKLLAAGFETPAPVAYVEERRFGLLRKSFFMSEQCPYGHRFYEFGDARAEDCTDVVTAFARFTAKLHEAGILHRDYSPGNILFDRIDGRWHFCLVDINRMRFERAVTVEEGCANFARLWGQPDWFRLLAHQYAAARGADPSYCERLVMAARERFWRPRVKGSKLEYTIRF